LGFFSSLLEQFASSPKPLQAEHELSPLARKTLFTDGIRNLLVTHNYICNAFVRGAHGNSGKMDEFVVKYASNKLQESAGDRDAFCAMLACQMPQVRKEEVTLRDAVKWATAAMSCVRNELGVPKSMPTFEEVNNLVQHLMQHQIDQPD
jgi:sugar/nucleoside kinase (ribokinase family)